MQAKNLLILLGASVFLSEIILRINETAGFLLYSFLILGCLLSLSKAKLLNNDAKLLIVFIILPILRISELLIFLEFFWKINLVYLILFFLVTFYSVKFNINPGFSKGNLWMIPIVIVLSVILGFVGNFFFTFEKHPEFLFLLPLIAYSEEILFRGLIQNYSEKIYGVVASILFSSVLYLIFSLSLGIFAVIFIFIASLIIGIIYHFTKNIFLVIIMNFILHLFLFIFPQILL